MPAPAGPADRRVEVPVDVLFRELGGESVLLDLRTESYFGLDPVGTRMWHALAEARSVAGALAALEGQWDVEPTRLRGDLERLIQELAEQGLVVLDPA